MSYITYKSNLSDKMVKKLQQQIRLCGILNPIVIELLVLQNKGILTFKEDNKSKYIAGNTKLIFIRTSNTCIELLEKIIKACKINQSEYEFLLTCKWLSMNVFTVVP